MKNKRKKQREIIEWAVLIIVVGVIYLGGWQTQVIGKLQQGVLATGIFSPDLVEKELEASYDFQLRDLLGNELSFTEFEGQVVFLNFWATWCPPCIAEMPDIHHLYEQDTGTAFVMISLDRDKEKARKFIEEKGFTFPVYFLNSSLPSTYDIQSIPTTYLLSKDGKIKVKNHGMAKYNSKKFRALLSKLQ